MAYANSTAADEGRRGNATSAQLLSDLEKAHDGLVSALAVMESVTRNQVPERNCYVHARWRLSHASLVKRTLCNRTMQHLRPKLAPRDAASLDALQLAQTDLLRNSAAHVGKWTIDRIEADWGGYCDASSTLRWKIKAGMGAEKRILYPLLSEDALGLKGRSTAYRG